jgi:hypothetical protein
MTSVVLDRRILQIGFYTDIRKRNAVDPFKVLMRTRTQNFTQSPISSVMYSYEINSDFINILDFICKLVYF